MTRFSTWLGLGVLLAIAAAGAYFYLPALGAPATADIAFEGSCSPLQGVGGAEDLQIDPAHRRAFVSSFSDDGADRGSVVAFSIDDPLAGDAWSDRTGGAPEAFQPLGLYLYVGEGARRLFVVNAASKSVELYDVGDDGGLAHLESFTERRLTSPNDVVAVGPRAFYVTNDAQPVRGGFLAQVRALFPVGAGSILYFNGVSWSVAVDGLRLANGLNLSPDRTRLYLAETGARAVRIYHREQSTGVLTLAKTIRIGAAVDNINIDRTGALWIAAHGRMVRPGAKTPSLVLRYADIEGARTKPVGVYANDGSELSAATTAAKLGSTLLIGGLLEKKVLICTLPASVASR